MADDDADQPASSDDDSQDEATGATSKGLDKSAAGSGLRGVRGRREATGLDDVAGLSQIAGFNGVAELSASLGASGVAGLSAGVGAMLASSEAYSNLQSYIDKTISPVSAAFNDLAVANLGYAAESLASAYARNVMPSFDSINALARYMVEAPALTRPSDYAVLDAPASAYSSYMGSPQSYFHATEEVITCFDDLHTAITKLISKTPDLPLVWRGVRNADWGMHSHLYRHLMTTNRVVPPQKNPKEDQPYPDEAQMVAAEREILATARRDWRFDNMSALETFARIQHAGGPTRLIDVTKNPYIGAWFAVEFDEYEEDKDARLFALATKPVAREGKPSAPDSTLQLDDLGAARDPFWHLLTDNASRQKLDWGTGARRRVWVPPAYDPRISAQNAAFVLDGVPMTSAKLAPYFTAEKNVYWRRADLLASASIYAKMLKPTLKPKYNGRNFAPTFSFRIEAGAKQQIREVMESRFGYRLSYIYPDMAALAAHLKSRPLSG